MSSIQIEFNISHCTRQLEIPWKLTAHKLNKFDRGFQNLTKILHMILPIRCSEGDRNV